MTEIRFVGKNDKIENLPESFESYVRRWFYKNFEGLSEPQKYSFKLIHEKNNTLICAPTGSGKTLGAFLSILNELFLLADKGRLENKIYALYVSPLKALNNDIEKNLKEPLEGIRKAAEEMGVKIPEITAEVRTGDTSSSRKSRQLKKTPHILITTPETLAIILCAPKFREKLSSIKYVIVDEIHALCENKRGPHLVLSLERLEELSKNFVRIGLSATQSPIEEIAKFLFGYENGKSRKGVVVDIGTSKELDLKVLSPVEDLIYTPTEVVLRKTYALVHKLIQEHRTTLIFTNTRAGTERIVHGLKVLYPKNYNSENIGAHHSSMSKEERLNIENKLKSGKLKAVVTSTSLELGIDIGYIDLVIQLSSPKGIARAIQRIGRSGHKLHEISKGRVIVMSRDDALECAVMMKCAKEGQLDRVRIPRNCLDILAQHIVGMGIERVWKVDEAFEVVRRSYCYKDLAYKEFVDLLSYLAGEYADLEDQKVYGKIWLDLNAGEFGRRGKTTRMIYMTNLGAIPDESHYKVYTKDRFVGTLDEEFMDRLIRKDIFVLGGKTYEFLYSRGMNVYVIERPELNPTVPSWFSEMLPLSYDLGIEIGNFCDKVKRQLELNIPKDLIAKWILENYYVNENAAKAIAQFLEETYKYIGGLPTQNNVIIEETYDELGRKNIVFHTIYGRKVNDALSRIFAYCLGKMLGRDLMITVGDHGFVIITPRLRMNFFGVVEYVLEQNWREILKKAVRNTDLMKRRFRHVATRSFMILRSYMGRKKSVGRQQVNAHFLFGVCEKIDPNFPIIKETYREILEDVMDIERAEDILNKIKSGEITYKLIETDVPSPFAHYLVVQGEGDVLMMEDRRQKIERLHRKIMEKIGEM